MTACTFIHAADLHLDAQLPPPKGAVAVKSGSALSALLRDATFTALSRLTDLCLEADIDFLLLAGDMYNSADSSLKARMALRDAVNALQGKDIGVFIAHGNHDPLSGAAADLFPWPDNATVFAAEAQSSIASKNGVPKALVSGVSHADAAEARNLARQVAQLPPTPEARNLFRIGLVHCALSGFSGGHEKYAPCSFADLSAGDVQYWALGHVHMPLLLDGQGKPLGADAAPGTARAAYCGSLQGLHVNESGRHGCLFCQVDDNGRLSVAHIPLAPVQWEQLHLEPGEDIADMPALEAFLLNRLAAVPAAAPLSGGAGPAAPLADRFPPEAYIVRLRIGGRTPLNHILRKPGLLDDMTERLAAELVGTPVLLRDIQLQTSPLLDKKALLHRADLAGEMLRAAQAVQQTPDELHALAQAVLAPLFDRPKAKGLLLRPDAEELAALAEEAAFLCLDLLDPEESGGEENG